MPKLEWSPLVPLPVLAAVAAVALAALVLVLIARRRGGVMRAVAIAALLAALGNPSFVKEEKDRLKDVVAVVIDRTGSQRLADRRAQTDSVKAELERRLASMPAVEARFIEATDRDDEGSALFAALEKGLSDVPPERIAGAILVTDGRVHDIPTAASALGFRAPLHALVTGRPDERDRLIELVDAPRFGIVGKDQTIRFRVRETGGDGAPMRLSALLDGRPIAERRVRPGETVRLPVRIEHGGPNVVELALEAAPGELTEANNKAVVTVEGIRDKLKVLLVSGRPHSGQRTWRNMLKSDAAVDLVHFTILRPPEKQDGTPINELSLIAFPTRELFETKIKEFDLIIFDRYSNQSILPAVYFTNIVRYVRDGGAVLVAAGPEFRNRTGLAGTPLAAVMPAEPDGQVIERPFRTTITDAGRRHPVTRGLPGGDVDPPAWGEWMRQISAVVKTGTPVLSGPEDRPMLILSREGKGRVALLLSDHAWLWAREYHGGGPHLDLLRRTGHWLMKEPDLDEEALRARATGGRLSIERQTMTDGPRIATVIAPSGKERPVPLTPDVPGVMRGEIEAEEIGLHRVREGDLVAFAGVGPANPREFRDVVSTTEMLTALAEATGGSVRRVSRTASDAPRVPSILLLGNASRYSGSDYIGLKDTDTHAVKGVGVWSVFLGATGLLLLVASLLAAWLAEGGFSRRSRAQG